MRDNPRDVRVARARSHVEQIRRTWDPRGEQLRLQESRRFPSFSSSLRRVLGGLARRIKRIYYPARPEGRVPDGPAPLITSHEPAYLVAISSKGGRGRFETIGTVHDHLVGAVHQELGDLVSREEVDEYLKRDHYPIPATVDRENYHGERHFDWWLSGLTDYLLIKRKLGEHGAPLCAGDVVFELGCATGRVLRHFAIQEAQLDCWGADIKLRHIEWMRLFLPPHLRIFQNTILPGLPIEDNSVSLVTAFSVFTHIDELEFAWLAELRRILKPGGFLYATIHSERTWGLMRPGVEIYDALMTTQARNTDYQVSDSFLRGPMPKEKTVLYWGEAQNYNCNVFHSTSYIEREWGRFFDVEEVVPGGSFYQDVIMLRKGAKPAQRP